MQGAGMTGTKRRRQTRCVAALSMLVLCSACSDESAKQSSSESQEPPLSSLGHLTEPSVSKNTSADCKLAQPDIAAGDQGLEKAFSEWLAQREAFYEARKSAFLSGANNKNPSAEGSIVARFGSFNDAGSSQKDDGMDTNQLDDKQSSLYAAYRKADETLSGYDQIGCIEPDEYLKKHQEYNALLGRN